MTEQHQGSLPTPMTADEVESLAAVLEAAHREYQQAEADYTIAREVRRTRRAHLAKLIAMWAEARWLARDGTLQQQQVFQAHVAADLGKLLQDAADEAAARHEPPPTDEAQP